MDCKACGTTLRGDNVSGVCRKHKHLRATGNKRFYVQGPKMSDDDIARLRVDREPCGFCGVRGDIGCAHQRRAAA